VFSSTSTSTGEEKANEFNSCSSPSPAVPCPSPVASQQSAQQEKKGGSWIGSSAKMVAPMVIASAGLGMLAGVAMANRTTGDGLPAASRWDARPRCSTCRGTGREECLCSRWSDGDVGCGTCSGSGRKRCRSCGGSGTGRQLPARLIVQQQKLPNAHGRRGDHN
uniref:Uncharacterized protein n=3 Tax=Triticinae TaxID=1648030 RepID=A0A453PQ78_AEGTS